MFQGKEKRAMYLHGMLTPATREDIDFLFSLYMHPQVNRWLLYDPMDRDAFEPIALELLARHALFVYDVEGIRAGMCKLVPQRYRNAHIVYLGGVAIDPAWQGKGIAVQMLRAAIDWSRERGYHRIELTVAVENSRAIALYEQLGFVREGILRDYTWLQTEGIFIDEQVMALILR